MGHVGWLGRLTGDVVSNTVSTVSRLEPRSRRERVEA